MPNVIFPARSYIAELRRLAWIAAGWKAVVSGVLVEVWGPPSIRHSIDLDVLELTGCLDARL